MEDLEKASVEKSVRQDDTQIIEALDETSEGSTAVAAPKVQTCPKPKTASNPELRRRISVSSEEDKSEFRVPADKPCQLGKRRTPLKSSQARIQPSKTSEFASPIRANLKRPASASASPSSTFIRPHAEKEGEVKSPVEPKDKDATSKSDPPVVVEGFEAKILEHPHLYLKGLSKPQKEEFVNRPSEVSNSKESEGLGSAMGTDKSMNFSETPVSTKLQEPNVNVESISVTKVKDPEFEEQRAITDSASNNSKVLLKAEIKTIDSDLCHLIDEIYSYDEQLDTFREEQIQEEKDWRIMFSAMKDTLESLKQNDLKPPDLHEKERFNPELTPDECQRVLELQIHLGNTRRHKSHISKSIETLQTKRLNAIDNLENKLCLRLGVMRNLHNPGSILRSHQNVEIPTEITEGKSVSHSENELLTAERHRKSLPLTDVTPKLLRSKWIAINDQETKTEPNLVKEFCKMRSVTVMKMDTAKSMVSELEKSLSILKENIAEIKYYLLETRCAALLLGGINENEICEFLKAGKQMDADCRYKTRIYEIREVHSKSYARLAELCDAYLVKMAVENVMSWMDSLSSSIREGSSMELDLESFEIENQTAEKAYSELLDFLKNMGRIDSEIAALYHQVHQHASQKSALSQKLIGCVFNVSPKVVNKNPELSILEGKEIVNNFEMISSRMQHSRNISRIVEYCESISECKLELSNKLESLNHNKSEMQNLFMKEFPSKFLPALCLDALRQRKAESLERDQSLGRRVRELMAGLEVLHQRNAKLIANVMEMLGDHRQLIDSSEVMPMASFSH